MDNSKLDLEFIDRLYAVAMEPERFEELARIWQRRLSELEGQDAEYLSGGLKHLESHLTRAETLLSISSETRNLLPAPLKEKLESEPHPMLAFDGAGHVAGVNSAAISVFGLESDVTLTDLPIDEEAKSVIKTHLKTLSRRKPGEDDASLVRAWRTDKDVPLLLSLRTWATASGVDQLLVKAIDFVWSDKLTPLVRKAFNLTEAEATVMTHLAAGLSASQVAERRGASIATVRAQIRSLYEKMSIRNQSEFMRMTLGLSSLGVIDRYSLTGAFQVPQGLVSPPYPREEDRRLFRLSDGRLLDYSEYGARDGNPVLFMHSEFFGDGCSGEMGDYARRKNLRFIAPARPHYGRSSAYPVNALTHQQHAADICELLDHLGLDTVVCFSQVMAPSLFAIALADAYPERLRAMVLLAPLYPFGTKDSEAKLDFFHRYLSTIIHRNPRMLRFISKAGLAFHNRVGSRKFFKTFASGRAPDVAIVEDDIGYAAMTNGALIIKSSQYDGYYNDYRTLLEDVSGKLRKILFPVKVITGDQFPRGAHANILKIVKDRANYTEIVATNGGQYLMFTHPFLIVDTLANMSGAS